MTDDETTPAIEKIQELVGKHARAERHLAPLLAERILEHEHAVQFDEKRYDAITYIRGLINETLDDELGTKQ